MRFAAAVLASIAIHAALVALAGVDTLVLVLVVLVHLVDDLVLCLAHNLNCFCFGG